jgi:DNA primase
MALTEWLVAALAASGVTDDARDYLMGRGATDEVIDAWQIKVFDCPREVCPDTRRHEHYGAHFERFEGKIIYPLHCPRGRLLGFEARSINAKDVDQFLLDDSRWNPVWIGMPSGMLPIWEGRDVIVVEGIFDAFAMLHVANGRSVLGSRSAHLSWKHVEFLRRWCKGTVLMTYDRDDAGAKGNADALQHLSNRRVRCAELSYGRRGDDPGEIWDRGGVKALREAFPKL